MALPGLIKSFRKYTKVWMAGMILVSMITFVLCTGVSQGDFGSWLLSLFGGGRNRGDTLAQINGKEVTALQIANLRVQRKTANLFMIYAGNLGRNNRLAEIMGQLESRTKELLFNTIMDNLKRQYGMFQSIPPNQLDRFGPELRMSVTIYNSLKQLQDQKQLPLDRLLQTGSAFLSRDLATAFTQTKQFLGTKRSQVTLLSNLQSVLEDMAKARDLEGKNEYFEGGETDEGLFEFILWRNEADRLNIQLNDNSVREEVKAASSGGLRAEDWPNLVGGVRRRVNPEAREDSVINALRDEFRVRLAQYAHLSYLPGPRTTPVAGVTPIQAWKYYQDNFANYDVAILRVPVESFLSKVPKPTDQELADFFDKYKSQEKKEDSSEPGFKEPKKVKVQWLQGSVQESHYRDLKPHKSLDTPVLGLGITQGWNQHLEKEYEGLKETQKIPSVANPLTYTPYHYLRGWRQPANVAALLGQGFTPYLPLAAPAVYEATAFARLAPPDVNKRAAFAATLILSGATPCPGFPGLRPDGLPLAGLLVYGKGPETSTTLPFKEVLPEMIDHWDRQIASQRFQADWYDLLKKLDRFNPAEKDEDIRKRGVMERVQQAARNYGFTFGPNPKDPNESTPWLTVAELKAGKYKPVEELKKETGLSSLDIAFFDKEGPYLPRRTDPQSGKGFMFWKTDLQNDKIPDSFQDIRAEVEKQWRYFQARQLARKRAEKMAAALAKLSADDDKGRAALIAKFDKELLQEKIIDPGQTLIELKEVARHKEEAPLDKKQPLARPPQSWNFQKYTLPVDLFIKPQESEWVQKLVTLGEPEQKKALVLVNEPESVFYVAARVSSPTASAAEFARAYEASTNTFWNDCRRYYGQEFRADLVAQLKKQQKFEDLRKDKNRRGE